MKTLLRFELWLTRCNWIDWKRRWRGARAPRRASQLRRRRLPEGTRRTRLHVRQNGPESQFQVGSAPPSRCPVRPLANDANVSDTWLPLCLSQKFVAESLLWQTRCFRVVKTSSSRLLRSRSFIFIHTCSCSWCYKFIPRWYGPVDVKIQFSTCTFCYFYSTHTIHEYRRLPPWFNLIFSNLFEIV